MSDLAIKKEHTGNYRGKYFIITRGTEGNRNLIEISNDQANNLIEIINNKNQEILNINNSFYRVNEIRKILTEHERDNLY